MVTMTRCLWQTGNMSWFWTVLVIVLVVAVSTVPGEDLQQDFLHSFLVVRRSQSTTAANTSTTY